MAPNAPRGRTTDDSRPRLLARPALEPLEDRATPATVTTLSDSGAGSLRDAIASTSAGGTVDFAPGLTGVITLNSQITIGRDLTIVGPGLDSNGNAIVTISGNNATRIFDITNNASSSITVSISKLTLINGKSFNVDGGAVAVANENVTFSDVTITGSNATGVGSAGGAIVTGGNSQLTLNRCTIRGNSSQAGGGGVYLGLGSFNTIKNSTISGNKAIGGDGGGVYVD